MSNTTNKKQHSLVKFSGSIALLLTVAGVLLAIGGQLDFLGNERKQTSRAIATQPAEKEKQKPKYSFYEDLKKRKTELEENGQVASQKVISAKMDNEAIDGPRYVVQVGAFSREADANRMKNRVQNLGYPGRVVTSRNNKFLTQAGPFSKSRAQSVQKRLHTQKLDTLLKRIKE